MLQGEKQSMTSLLKVQKNWDQFPPCHRDAFQDKIVVLNRGQPSQVSINLSSKDDLRYSQDDLSYMAMIQRMQSNYIDKQYLS